VQFCGLSDSISMMLISYILSEVNCVKGIIIALIVIFAMNSVSVSAMGVSAQYACVIEQNSGEVVYEKNAYQRHSMASTTKIMTALIAIEQGRLDEVVTASRNASVQEGSSIYLRAGDKIMMRDLLYGLMLNSGNDAAVAVAEHISGSVEEFAKLMTETAKSIGAENTQFKNPNGLDADGHYTTAYDLALIARYAMQNEDFKEIVSTKSKKVTMQSGTELYLSNHNKMLKIYEGANGVKTGFTKATGRCLVSSAERNGVSFIAVTLNAPDDWTDHKNMLDFAFAEYARMMVVDEGDILKTVSLDDGRTIEICAGSSVDVVMKKNSRDNCEVILHLAKRIVPPLNEGERLGVAEVEYNGVLVDRFYLVNKNEICVEEDEAENVRFSKVWGMIIGKWLLH